MVDPSVLERRLRFSRAFAARHPPPASDLAAEVKALRQELADLRASLSPSPALGPGPELLSLREAARQLGVSRTRTLPALIRAGHIKTVRVGGREKIRASDLALLQTSAAKPRRRSGPSPGASIRAIKL